MLQYANNLQFVHNLCISALLYQSCDAIAQCDTIAIDSRVTGIGSSINTSFVILLFYIMPMVNHPG